MDTIVSTIVSTESVQVSVTRHRTGEYGVDDEYGPEEFEKRFGIPRARYESKLLELARTEAVRTIYEAAPERSAVTLRGSVVDVKLAGEGAAVELVLLFRIAGESVLCGVRERVWPAPDPTGDMSTPEMTAKLWIWNVVEIFESTPTSELTVGADAQGIVWWDDP
jgi:hypothetical protein